MIRVNDNLYPIGNIKNISISNDSDGKPILIYYFKEDTKLRPVTENFIDSSSRNKKLDEILGRKGKVLFG